MNSCKLDVAELFDQLRGLAGHNVTRAIVGKVDAPHQQQLGVIQTIAARRKDRYQDVKEAANAGDPDADEQQDKNPDEGPNKTRNAFGHC